MNDFNKPDTVRIPVNDSTRDRLISAYAEAIIEDMDLKSLIQLALETVTKNLEEYTDEELETEMIECYEELLEEEIQ
jgi:hypothetical protein